MNLLKAIFSGHWQAFHVYYLFSFQSPRHKLCPTHTIMDSDRQEKDIWYLASWESARRPLKS